MVFNSLVPRSPDQLTPQIRNKFRHYSEIYKTFIRPAMATALVYHHAPVNASGGVETGHWFAMQFVTPDRSKSWAVVIRLDQSTDAYAFKPRGLDGHKQYRVVFDSSGKNQSLSGAALASTGLNIQPSGKEISELLLLTAQ